MAKKKNQEPIAEEIAEVIEETEEPVAEVKAAEPTEPEMTDTEKFIYAQLKVINRMNNPAKAQRLAERVLRNRKGN